MGRLFSVDPSLPLPIWSQIEDAMRRLVGSGSLAPGQAIPSVRDLARDLRVNPATVSRAYQRLAEQGLLEARRGDGTFVSGAPPAMGRVERARRLRDAALQYASLARTVGASRDETVEHVKAAWAELGRQEKGQNR